MRFVYLVSMVVIASGAGCKNDGGGGGQLADAPTQTDAPADSPPDTAGPQPITLTVTLDGVPVAGVHTYFLKADGSLGDAVDTNAQGIASSLKADGGSVTALDPFGEVEQTNINDLRTFMGVKAGDHLVLSESRNPPQIDVTVTAPAGPNGIDSWEVFTSCGGGSIQPVVDELGASDPTGTFTLANCATAADILVVGTGEGGMVASLYHPNFPVPAEGQVDIDLTADTYVDARSVGFNYSNVPDNAFQVETRRQFATPRGRLDLELDGGSGIEEGTAVIDLIEPNHAGLFGATDTFLRMQSDGGLRANDFHIYTYGALAPSYDIDLAASANQLLPGFTSDPGYDVASSSLLWDEAATGATPDLTRTKISVLRELGVGSFASEITPPGTNWEWQLVAPYKAGELKFPTLPTDIRNWAPGASDGVQVELLVNAKVPGHYDAVRARVLNDVSPSEIAAAGALITVEVGPVPDRTRSVAKAPARHVLTNRRVAKQR
jgi:hypothetical protein